jgi:hypothetical protein
MATFSEISVEVRIILRRDTDGDHAVAQGHSITDQGTVHRAEERDIYDQLTATQKTRVGELLDRAETYYRTRWGI